MFFILSLTPKWEKQTNKHKQMTWLIIKWQNGVNALKWAQAVAFLHKKFSCRMASNFFSFLSTFLTSAVISRFISNSRWLFHISKHHPKYNNQKESEKINQCPQTTDRFWQVQFIHKSYSSLGILLSCIHNALDSDASLVSARWQPRWEDVHCSSPGALFS